MRDQGQRRPRPRRWWPPPTPARSPPRPSSPRTSWPPRRCRSSRAHLAATGGRAAAVVLNSGNANAATGADGRGARRADVRDDGRRRSGARPTRCWSARPASSASRFPIEVVEAGMPGAGRRPLARGRRRRGPGHHDHRHRGQGGARRPAAAFTVGGMAKGAAMLAPNMATMLAVLTTDAAARAGRAARPRCSEAVDRQLQPARESTAARRPTTP